MDEQNSEKSKKNDVENKTLIRVAIFLCVSLIVVLVWGIYASQNIRLGEFKIIQPKTIEFKTKQSGIYKTEIQSEVEQVSLTQPSDVFEMLRVSKVVDGDTIVVESVSENNLSKDALQKDTYGIGEKFTVRIIGINTPETVDPRKKVECFGKEASVKAKEMLLGKIVRLEYDDTQDTLDKYGRKLAYVFIQNNVDNKNQNHNTNTEMFFNKYMIEQGYAYEYTYSKAYKYQKEFKDAQKTAEVEERGLWASETCAGKKNI